MQVNQIVKAAEIRSPDLNASEESFYLSLVSSGCGVPRPGATGIHEWVSANQAFISGAWFYPSPTDWKPEVPKTPLNVAAFAVSVFDRYLMKRYDQRNLHVFLTRESK